MRLNHSPKTAYKMKTHKTNINFPALLTSQILAVSIGHTIIPQTRFTLTQH
jgi:hypothetical protein